MKINKIFAATAISLMSLSAFNASAAQINFGYNTSDFSDSKGQAALAGFEQAGAFWESILEDNITLNINIGFSALGSNVIGQANSSTAVFYYSDFADALSNDGTSAYDTTAINSLDCIDLSNSYCNRVFLENETGSTTLDNDGTPDNFAMSITQANAKAVGLTQDSWGNAFSNIDGNVTFSSDFAFDFDNLDGIESGKMDFVGVAIHEIGHVLGFVSGVDTYDYHKYNNTGEDLDFYAVFNSLDLFRYSEESYAMGEGTLDFRTGADVYFSLDGGATNEGALSSGEFTGNGHQASHWEDNEGLGIMDPTFAYGEEGHMSTLDAMAMDAIGWDVNYAALNFEEPTDPDGGDPVGVPLPASAFLLTAGLLGIRLRRKS